MVKKAAPQKTKIPWWKNGIIYQIYVRSFYDSNGDGIGDLPGVTTKLDYLQNLGVDGIWLSPITVSANEDWGYDVVDYYNIDPALGTMADFDNLIKEAGKRKIHILLDFVPNHTSIYHPWFQNALTGRDAKYRDYYIWVDPAPGGKPPNNWQALNAGGRAWEYHKPTGQFYLHNFQKQQADLNWRNPKVKDEFDKIIHFWIDRGIDGFRIDTFNMLIKDRFFRDNPKSEKTDGLDIKLVGQKPLYNTTQPEVHSILKHWRKTSKGRLLLGESTVLYNVRQLAAFYGEQDELELAFNLAFIHSTFDAPSLRKVIEDTESAFRAPDWPVWTNSNHDQSRFPTRWAKGDERKIRCGLMLLLGLKGTPVMYYGDELGMQDVFVPPWRLKDPTGKRLWPIDGGRDRSRTPMPWAHKKGAGFTKENVRPWLPYGHLQGANVEEQSEDPYSLMNFTRDLIAVRRNSPDLTLGEYRTLPSPPDVWAWQRGKQTIVVLNLSNNSQDVIGIYGMVQLSTHHTRDGEAISGDLTMKPWEGMIIKMSQNPGE